MMNIRNTTANRRFAKKRVDLQTWSFVLLFNFSAGCQFCDPPQAGTPPETFSVRLVQRF